jgi:heterodisulfide reductase subunit B
MSIRESLPVLDVELIDIENLSCCGESVKSVNQLLTLYLSARNLAIAEQRGFDLLVPCAMCHLALSECRYILHGELKERINDLLASEDLDYKGEARIVHTIDLLYDCVNEIKRKIERSFDGVRIATHYGCRLIRPSETGRSVDSENPRKIETILNAIGIKTMDYAERLDCCGAPILANLPDSALTKTGQKLQAIQEQGFDAIVTVCPWCQKMFDSKQKKAGESIAAKLDIPVLYLTQLVGLALGVKRESLGLDLNLSPELG